MNDLPPASGWTVDDLFPIDPDFAEEQVELSLKAAATADAFSTMFQARANQHEALIAQAREFLAANPESVYQAGRYQVRLRKNPDGGVDYAITYTGLR